MRNKLLLTLSILSATLLLLLVGFLAGSLAFPGKPAVTQNGDSPEALAAVRGQTVQRKDLARPPPPPAPVNNPDRVRQNLRPGKTYATHTKGVMHMRGVDKDWGFETVVTINYAFEALIDREIESNDGVTIVELRHFRDLRSLKMVCTLEDARLDLGLPGKLLLAAIVALQPEAAPVAGAILKLDGASWQPALQALRWADVSPDQFAGLNQQSAKMFAKVDRLSGKSVRLTYVDGKGVLKLEAVKGTMTVEERDFHLRSVLVSDSLIFPDVDIRQGVGWHVSGSNFANLIDPGMLAATAGEVRLERAGDDIVDCKTCRHIKVVGGRITINDSDAREGRVGHFDPLGSLYFSPEDQVIIGAKLRGKANLERFSKTHLLYAASMRRQADLEVDYTCHVTDTPKVK